MEVSFFRSSCGARIAYAVVGTGPPLVLLPAWSSHLEGFWELEGHRRLCARLATRHRVIMYDRWGTGLSDRTRTDMSLDADVQVLADVVAELRVRRVALVGPSHGAPTAAAYAVRKPTTVSQLVLYSPVTSVSRQDRTWTAMRQLLLANWEVGSRAVASVLMAGADSEEIAAFARLWRRSSSAEVAVALQDVLEELDLGRLYEAVRVPTLVLSRRGDPVAAPSTLADLAGRIPTAQLVVLEGEAHLPHEGDVDALVDAILACTSGRRGLDAAGLNGPAVRLTPREREILQLMAQGMSNKSISDRLVLSVRTVERHTLNIYLKLGVRGRGEAVAAAYGPMGSPEPA